METFDLRNERVQHHGESVRSLTDIRDPGIDGRIVALDESFRWVSTRRDDEGASPC